MVRMQVCNVSIMDEVSVIDVPAQLVAGMRKEGAYDEIAGMILALFAYLASREMKMAGPPVFVCHEKSKDEVVEAQRNASADIEVALPVASSGEEREGVRFYKLPGGKMARIIHKGPYEKCEPAYDKLFAWVRENGKRVAGPSREVYLNDPREVGLDNAVTEILVPIE